MNTQKTFGTVNARGEFISTSATLHGAKLAANRSGLHVVAQRSALGYNVDIVARKLKAGVWVDDRQHAIILGLA